MKSKLLLFLLFGIYSHLLLAKQWLVKPGTTYPNPQSVNTLVADGDTINIEAALYSNQIQVSFTKNNLLIRGINGRPRLEAGSLLAANTNGKAIFVISGKNCHVHNIEFANAAVLDHNGAGIRQEGCDLLVTNCYFNGNEMGILGGNLSPCKVTMEHNLFANNGSQANPGYQHNIYINHIDTFIFRYNYSINAIAEGHELKSRAHRNIIMYNYIANLNTVDSRNIDIPNGGTAVIVGNIIEQGQNSSNSNIIGFGLEGFTNTAPHNIWLSHNTIVNKKSTGSFVQVANGTDTLFLKNNIMVGAKTGGLLIGSANVLDSSSNFINNSLASVGFVNEADHDYHLTKNSPLIDKGSFVLKHYGNYNLSPLFEYADTAKFTLRKMYGIPDIGAFEFVKSATVNRLESKQVSMYPNPVTNLLNLDLPNHTPFEIYTIDGRYVLGGLILNKQIDIDVLPKAIYHLKAGDYQFKFMKQ